MHTRLVKPVPIGVKLTAFFDCSHSATMLDLPFHYDPLGKLEQEIKGHSAAESALTIGVAGMRLEAGGVGGIATAALVGGKELIQLWQTNKHNTKVNKGTETNMSPADIVSYGACKDKEVINIITYRVFVASPEHSSTAIVFVDFKARCVGPSPGSYDHP